MEKRKVYGVAHAAQQLGMDRDTMLEHAVMDDCPSVCSVCGAVNESGHEPDARDYNCEACGAGGSVNSVLVLAGVV